MAYNQLLADRIREELINLEGIEEKAMIGSLIFMLKGKMCVRVTNDEMLCRIDPAIYEEALEKNGCHEMNLAGRVKKGWVKIEEFALRSTNELNYWIGLAVDYNKYAKSSKKKK